MWPTLIFDLIGGGATLPRDLRAPWFRDLSTLDPAVDDIAAAPPIHQLHAVATVAVLAVWPFRRLVPATSYEL